MKQSSTLKSKGLEPSYLVFTLYHNLEDLYQGCSNYASKAKTDLAQVSTGAWSVISRNVSFKQNAGERLRATWPSCFFFIDENSTPT